MRYLRKFKLNESVEGSSTSLTSALDNIQKEADAKKNELIESLITNIEEIFYDVSDHDEMKSETKKFEKVNAQGKIFALDTKIEANLFDANGETITEEVFETIIDSISMVERALKIKPSAIDYRFSKVREVTDPSRLLSPQIPIVKWNNDAEQYLTDLKDKFRSAQISYNTMDARALVGAKKVYIWIRW